jgi:hypothetical protein
MTGYNILVFSGEIIYVRRTILRNDVRHTRKINSHILIIVKKRWNGLDIIVQVVSKGVSQV